jgi:hypothetical protein
MAPAVGNSFSEQVGGVRQVDGARGSDASQLACTTEGDVMDFKFWAAKARN